MISLRQVFSFQEIARKYREIPFDEETGLKYYLPEFTGDENTEIDASTDTYLIEEGQIAKGLVIIGNNQIEKNSIIQIEPFVGLKNKSSLDKICSKTSKILEGNITNCNPEGQESHLWGTYIDNNGNLFPGLPQDYSVVKKGLETAIYLARLPNLLYPLSCAPELLNVPALEELGFKQIGFNEINYLFYGREKPIMKLN